MDTDRLFDLVDDEDCYDGDSLDAVAVTCRHVLLRLIGRAHVLELCCIRDRGHKGDHAHVTIMRTRPVERVAVAGGVV